MAMDLPQWIRYVPVLYAVVVVVISMDGGKEKFFFFDRACGTDAVLYCL